jgi:pyruvate, water dikinase
MRRLTDLLQFKYKNKKSAKHDQMTDLLRLKYKSFQNLLRENNAVLGLMADMEEKASGEYLFDMSYVNSNVQLLSSGVLKILDNLDALSAGKYKQLFRRYEEIRRRIEIDLTRRFTIPHSNFTVPVEDLSKEAVSVAGGKIAHLSEIRNVLKFPTPSGFVITSYAFKKLMEYNNFPERIQERLSAVRIDRMEELSTLSREIQDMITAAEIPEDLQKAIETSVERLKMEKLKSNAESLRRDVQTNQRLNFSVRSSAVFEDGDFTFAGQYSTFLNVPEHKILLKYKEVVASLFTQRAVFYYKTKGFSEADMVMAVGVLEMIDPKAAGVMYTRDPNNPESDVIIINAVLGLGRSLVDGTQESCCFIFSRQRGAITEKSPADQQTMFICDQEEDIKEIDVPDELRKLPCLAEEQIKRLSEFASQLETYYEEPQDIEWAIDHEDRIYLLQSRSLRTMPNPTNEFRVPRKIEGHAVLIDKGVIACKGIGFGKVFTIRDEEDLKNFPDGAVLVARHPATKFVTVMNRASAIIADIGGATGHMASLSREYRIPTILDTGKATSILKDGQEITVDAFNCNIYEGRVEELIRTISDRRPPAFRNTYVFTILERTLKWITPLNLTDPDDENFKPESCGTFHDITRFAHEKAMSEMFDIGTEYDEKGTAAVTLKAGIPMDARVIDIEGGMSKDLKSITPDDISSIPFLAFVKGLISMRWPGPQPADARGFLGMMARTASIREEELYETGKKSFALISRNYMNFSIRLGYHFSLVEAYAGENINDNYIRFFFKGGGAALDRRLRRVELIKHILRQMDFRVTVKEDVINAVISGYGQGYIEEKLEIMGKLTAYTKQLDMTLYNDSVASMFKDQFTKEHMKQYYRYE